MSAIRDNIKDSDYLKKFNDEFLALRSYIGFLSKNKGARTQSTKNMPLKSILYLAVAPYLRSDAPDGYLKRKATLGISQQKTSVEGDQVPLYRAISPLKLLNPFKLIESLCIVGALTITVLADKLFPKNMLESSSAAQILKLPAIIFIGIKVAISPFSNIEKLSFFKKMSHWVSHQLGLVTPFEQTPDNLTAEASQNQPNHFRQARPNVLSTVNPINERLHLADPKIKQPTLNEPRQLKASVAQSVIQEIGKLPIITTSSSILRTLSEQTLHQHKMKPLAAEALTDPAPLPAKDLVNATRITTTSRESFVQALDYFKNLEKKQFNQASTNNRNTNNSAYKNPDSNQHQPRQWVNRR